MTAPLPPTDLDDAAASDATAEVAVRRRIPFRHIVPNLITILSICAGMTGMRLAFEGRFELAVGMVIGAALLDGIDGRIARLLKGQSRFGAEMDSLADIVNFGVVPGMVLYAHSLREAGSAGWIAALLFAATCALRLARFNTMLDGPKRPEWQSAFFTGVPAPAGAGLAMLPLYLSFTGIDLGSPKATALLSAGYLLVIGFLMASRIPTWSGKTIGVQIRREFVIPVILGLVLYVALLVSFLWETLSATTIAYFIAMIFSVRSFRRQAKADREAAAL
ncbi:MULTISPECIES: CDP-alcohol phosphatidyltransferase family protein [unclassified Aureimonas]|uniref:CDP-alcohol phosphatidyltransferase family protein n=1 Tax=unclassified Aureimonas TaxID=2615206 RepID=UPI0006F6F161|nr:MULTISPECIES: phosphatidylcholine/phosphatidylserine synthase [unclassified Aureimonas]KQT52906.1 CDP-diacylglycerol--serine O-phosphatidyltransferase [Aureimonas sp. Leaf427]KQT80365.1 CDP-diacylglycerol--serine O-phosphatidyltransferase [Aureimonas sp. Leaf460]